MLSLTDESRSANPSMLLLEITTSIEARFPVSGNDTNRMELLMTALALVDHE